MKSPALGVLLLAAASFLSAAEKPESRGEAVYRAKIEPVLVKYCYDCHGDGVDKGDFVLDEHPDYASLRADVRLWDLVRQMVSTHVMPPADEEAQPSLVQRDDIVAWIDENVFWFDPSKLDPGHITARRLNRNEYNNTVRDSLFLDIRPADEFPQDDSGYGFDNIGDVLSISPLHMEKYIRAARRIAEEAMKISSPGQANLMITAGKFYNQKGQSREDDGIRWLAPGAEIAAKPRVQTSGIHRVSMKLAARQNGGPPAKVRVQVNGKEAREFEITSAFKYANGPWQRVEFEAPLWAGENKLSLAFVAPPKDAAQADTADKDRAVALAGTWVDGPFNLSAPRTARFLSWLLDGKPAGPPSLYISGEDFQKGEGPSNLDTGAIQLISNGYVFHPLEIEKPGKHRFTVKAGALQAGNEPAKFEMRIAGKTIGAFSVTAKDQAPQWFHAEADLPQGRQKLEIWFLNDFYDEKTQADRNLWIHDASVTMDDPAIQALPATGLAPLVAKMGARVFRRPLAPEETAKWAAIAEAATKEGEPVVGALGFALEGMLISPSFLFRGNPKPGGPAHAGSAPVDEFSLAARLSYFLWSAPPDDKLMELAAKNELRKNLPAVVRRMIGDWRAKALTDNFAGQWLQLRDMDVVNPSRRLFGDFRELYSPMKKETEMFFEHVLHENRPVMDFVNADYTFVNGKLARFYGLPGVTGERFQKVSLKGTPRGGVMTHASLLTVTSNPTRTNIVKRGKFVLENILGTPPPPAPGGVAPINEEKIRFESLTLRQQFEAHRKAPSCAGCHMFLDPIGFALENYDAIGRWRDKDHGQAIDASGALIRGQEFKDWNDLRRLISTELSDQFVRNLAENVLTFALGRGLTYYDRPAVNEIVQRTKKAGLGFQDMIIAACESVPFQRMRVEAK